MTSPIPFVDLKQEWAPLRREVLDRIGAILDHGRFIGGSEISELEAALAQIAARPLKVIVRRWRHFGVRQR